MDMQTLALAFLTTVTVGGLAWVFIYPLLSGEKQAEKRRASFARAEPTALRVDDRARVRRVQVEESMKELEQRLVQSQKLTIDARISQAGLGWTKQQFMIGSGILGAVVMFAAFFGGVPLLPAIGLRPMAVSVAITQGAAQFVLSGAYSQAHLFVGMFLLGLAMGNVAILSSLFIIEAYGLSDYPRMMARIQLAGPIGSGIGPLMVGLLHGFTDGYRVPMIAMGTISLVGGVALFSTGIDSASRWRSRRAAGSGAGAVDPRVAEEVALAAADEAGVVGEPPELIAEAELELAGEELSRR